MEKGMGNISQGSRRDWLVGGPGWVAKKQNARQGKKITNTCPKNA